MATETRERYGTFLAVFNCHVNNADRKARRDFRAKFGPDAWQKHMTPFVRKGLMSIFDEPQNKHTKFYADAVTRYVNEGLPNA